MLGNLVNNNEAIDGEEACGNNDGITGDNLIRNSDSMYLMMMSNPDDDRTVTNWYKIHGADSFWFEMSNLNYDYYDVVTDYENLNGCCVERGKMELDNTELCM